MRPGRATAAAFVATAPVFVPAAPVLVPGGAARGARLADCGRPSAENAMKLPAPLLAAFAVATVLMATAQTPDDACRRADPSAATGLRGVAADGSSPKRGDDGGGAAARSAAARGATSP
jgi:hypothetical protein